MAESTEQMEYSSLNDIRMRKELLKKDIEDDDARIKALWKSLFVRPDAISAKATPGKRMQSVLSVGAGAFDGALLAWKLYRRFKRK